MEKKEIKKLVFQAYNLSTEDREVSFIVRTTQSLNKWFEEIYNDRDVYDSNESELARILRVVCYVNEVDIAAVKGKQRHQELVTAKREYGYLARKLTKHSLAEIGAEINRDHANVLYHNRKIKNWLEIPGYYLREKLEMIEAKL